MSDCSREGGEGDLRISPAFNERQLRTTWLWLGASALALAFIVRHLLLSGTWLDDYWQLWISGAPAAELPSRLVADWHPPWFNLTGRLFVLLAGGDPVVARIVNLFAAVGVLAGGLWLMRGLDAAVRWRALLMVVASAGPVGMTDIAATFRVYPWLIVFAALQAMVLLAVIERRTVQPLLAAAITTVSIALHYVHAIGAIAMALVTLGIAWRFARASAWPVAAGLVAGIVLDVTTGVVQLPGWRQNVDVNWIAESGSSALASFAAMAIDLSTYNVIAIVLIVVAILGRSSRSVLWLLAPIPLALLGWFAIDAARPMVVPRYLVSITALVAVSGATAWRNLNPTAIPNAVATLLVAIQPLLNAWLHPPLAGWEVGAKVAAGVRRSCPDAALYAVSAWRFRDHPESRSAAFEQPVMRFAYEQVGRKFGLDPEFVVAPTAVRFGECPAIVWMEAAGGVERSRVDAVLRRARLLAPSDVAYRYIPTGNGAVLLLAAPGMHIPNLSGSALDRPS